MSGSNGRESKVPRGAFAASDPPPRLAARHPRVSASERDDDTQPSMTLGHPSLHASGRSRHATLAGMHPLDESPPDLEVPDGVSSTLIGGHAAPEQMLEQARAERGSHPTPPTWDELEQALPGGSFSTPAPATPSLASGSLDDLDVPFEDAELVSVRPSSPGDRRGPAREAGLPGLLSGVAPLVRDDDDDVPLVDGDAIGMEPEETSEPSQPAAARAGIQVEAGGRVRKATPFMMPPPASASDQAPVPERPRRRSPVVLEVGSLAPAEVPGRNSSSTEEQGSPWVGALAVAAMALIGVAGWYFTQGGFERGGHAPSAVAAKPAPAAKPTRQAAPVKVAAAVSAPAPLVATTDTSEGTRPPATPVAEARSQKPARPQRRVVRQVAGGGKLVEGPEAVASIGKPTAKTAKPSLPVLQIRPRQSGAEASVAAKTGSNTNQLPEAPSREAVIEAMSRVRSDVLACGAGQGGVAEVEMTVTASGQVTHAVVGGDFAGSPVGSCIARAVRGAHFEPFHRESVRLVYPFAL